MRLGEIMKEKKITNRELAELTGISQRTLEAYRAGKSEPNFTYGMKIAKALKVNPIELLEEERVMKYEIRKNYIEVRKKADIVEGCTLQQNWQEPEILEVFESLEEAKEALVKYESAVRWMDSTIGFYAVEEFYIEENEYNKDGEWLSGGDVWEFAKNDFKDFN